MCCWFSPMACYAITKWLGYTSYACNATTELDTQTKGVYAPFFPTTGVTWLYGIRVVL